MFSTTDDDARLTLYIHAYCIVLHRGQGLGVAQYANGDTLIGNFVATHLDGYGVYVFGTSGRLRYAARSHARLLLPEPRNMYAQAGIATKKRDKM